MQDSQTRKGSSQHITFIFTESLPRDEFSRLRFRVHSTKGLLKELFSGRLNMFPTRVIRVFFLTFLLSGSALRVCGQEVVGPDEGQTVNPHTEQISTISPDSMQRPVSYEAYLIGPGDLLEIQVFQVEDLDTTVRVGQAGEITLPLLGELRAADLTSLELRHKIASRLGEKYVQDPQVTIFIKESHNQPVSVVGAVKNPGLYQLTSPKTLIEVLSLAGGPAPAAAGRAVTIGRREGFEGLQPADGLEFLTPGRISVDLGDLLYAQREELNIRIKPRDVVSVSKADVVYIVGEVKKQGGFVLRDQEKVSVLQALAMAEGLGRHPAKSQTLIIRRLEDGSRQEIPLKLGKILQGKAEDPLLAANDILFVPNSKAKNAFARTATAAVQVASGLLIWRVPY